MKFILSLLTSILLCMPVGAVLAQGVTPDKGDTVYASWNGSPLSVYNNMVSADANKIVVKWKITATDFPRDWADTSILGICDNKTCRQNDRDTFLWNCISNVSSLGSFISDTIRPGQKANFDLVLDLAHASNGTHYLTCSWQSIGGSLAPTKFVTFIVNKFPTEAPVVEKIVNNEISLYPNPAKNEVNVIYSYTQESNTICIYNVIGKLVNVYKFDGASANLNIESIPSGVYFLKFIDVKGDVVAIKKFTKED